MCSAAPTYSGGAAWAGVTGTPGTAASGAGPVLRARGAKTETVFRAPFSIIIPLYSSSRDARDRSIYSSNSRSARARVFRARSLCSSSGSGYNSRWL
jgi:hypothetical protein